MKIFICVGENRDENTDKRREREREIESLDIYVRCCV
jgi:hypothetical protein